MQRFMGNIPETEPEVGADVRLLFSSNLNLTANRATHTKIRIGRRKGEVVSWQ